MKTKNFKLNPIRAAVISAALMAANNVAMAAPVSAELDFICPFPLIGDQTIIAKITADYPESVVIGADGAPVSVGPINVEAITVVPDKARQGLAFVDATTITGVAHSVNTFHTTAGNINNNTDMTIDPTTIPADESGPFDVPASGVAPAQDFDSSHFGTVTLTVDDLIMDLRNLKADGSVAPAPVGEFTADCTLAEGQDNTLTTFEVTTIVAEADIDVDKTSIEYGDKLLGQSGEQTVTIKNTGGQILGINGISISGADASAFTDVNNCTTLDAGESCTATVTYTATAEGAQIATLVIDSTDADEPTVSVALNGTGITEQKPEIEVDISPINFGTITAGNSETRTILIENVGTAALTISGVTANGSDFSATNNCSTVAAGENCSAQVTYDAIDGTSAGSIVITSDDEDESTTTINLSGTGEVIVVDPCVENPSAPGCTDPDPTDLIIPVALDVNGSSYITANHGTIPLTGGIDSMFNLTKGTFTGDMNLNPTQGSFEIIQGWKRYQATAHIEFEPVGITEGSLVDGNLTATSVAYVKLTKVTKTMFGFINWPIGGGENCRTVEPVTFNIQSADGEYFDALSGGVVSGVYDLPKLENCGLLTEILSLKLKGEGNTIDLTLTPLL